MQKKTMLKALPSSIGIALAAISLPGCVQFSGSPLAVAANVPRGPSQPSWPNLPEKAACTTDLNRYQSVLWSDVSTGNLNQSVYDQIEADLSRAASACAEGRNTEARAIIRSTKLKHGYRAFL